MKRVLALLVMVAAGCAPGGDEGSVAQSPSPSPPVEESSLSSCEAAWETAASVSRMEDSHDDYRVTLTACATVEEWDQQNEAHGHRYDSGPSTVAQLCETLEVDERICSDARRAVREAEHERDREILAEREIREAEAEAEAEALGLEPMSEDAELELVATYTNGRVVVTGTSNLPDGTDVIVNVQGAQAKVSILGGTFRSPPMGPPGTRPPVSFYVVVPIASSQPDLVQVVIGRDGEHLTGPLVEDGAMGRVVRAEGRLETDD